MLKSMHPWISEVGRLLLLGSGSSWFGIWCPAHCSASVPLLASIFIAGFGLGALTVLGLLALFFLYPLPYPRPSPTASDSPAPNHRLLLTCMSEGGNLAFTIRQAILTLRHLADSLESALVQDQHEESRRVRSGPRAPASQRTSDWDLLTDSAASAAPSEPSTVQSASRVSESSCYNEVALLLTKAPQHCFDICSRLSGTVEFVKFRVQRAWEAGQ